MKVWAGTIVLNNVRYPIIYEHWAVSYVNNVPGKVLNRCGIHHEDDIAIGECPVASRWTILRATLPS